jgi:hypothetical protein
LQWFGRPFVGDGAHRLERLHPQMKQWGGRRWRPCGCLRNVWKWFGLKPHIALREQESCSWKQLAKGWRARHLWQHWPRRGQRWRRGRWKVVNRAWLPGLWPLLRGKRGMGGKALLSHTRPARSAIDPRRGGGREEVGGGIR